MKHSSSIIISHKEIQLLSSLFCNMHRKNFNTFPNVLKIPKTSQRFCSYRTQLRPCVTSMHMRMKENAWQSYRRTSDFFHLIIFLNSLWHVTYMHFRTWNIFSISSTSENFKLLIWNSSVSKNILGIFYFKGHLNH